MMLKRTQSVLVEVSFKYVSLVQNTIFGINNTCREYVQFDMSHTCLMFMGKP